ncbi:MAG: hypothetical protein LQ349_005739 [Xanthoria aureola]|nr:MAG: hypothetical protein LQ349_005739 [Xanthoria aureola]
MYEQWPVPGSSPRKLLNYKHLPDQIGTREWWFVLEAWRRYDPRITWDDIHMRQCRSHRPKPNTTQQLVRRNRLKAHMISWNEYGGAPAARDAQGYPLPSTANRVATWITDGKKRRNTTRGYTPGLRSPRLGDIPGNRVPWPVASSRAGRHRATARGRGTRVSTRGVSRGSEAGSHSTAVPQQPSHRSSGSEDTSFSQDEKQADSQGDTTDAEDQTSTQIQPSDLAAATVPLLERVAESLWLFYNPESTNDGPPHGHGSVNPAHQ